MVSTETVAAAMGAGVFAKALEDACVRFGIVTPLQRAHFLAQVAHESDGFATATEYASGKAYDTGARAIALGNTPEADGDGQLYRGRGLIQLTGRTNYSKYSQAIYGDDRAVRDPAMVAKLPDAALAAGWFWQWKRLNLLADRDDVVGITHRINGGENGLDDRKLRLKQAKKLLGIT